MRTTGTTRATGLSGSLPRPLGPELVALADRVANRLHQVLRALLGGLPEHARGASALSRHLSIDRATCQRVVSAAAEARPDAHLLTRVPGTRGLRQFLAAVGSEGLAADVLASAEDAVEQFQDVLERAGGSQSRLAARLAVSGGAVASAESLAAQLLRDRQALHDAAVRITGRRSELSSTTFAYRPCPDDPGRIEGLAVSGFIGHVARPDSVPLVFVFGSQAFADEQSEGEPPLESLDGTPALGRTPRAVLTEFSTSPLPMVTSTGPRGLLVQTADPKVTDRGEPIDLVIANRTSTHAAHPALDDPPVHEAWCLIHFPARRLVFDVLLHRDLARQCIPSVDLHLWRPGFEHLAGLRWTTRFAHSPGLQVYGPGLRGATCETWPRHGEMLAHVFERVGWQLDCFVGHRCDVEYPVWRAGYCMSFDFTGQSAD